MFLSLVRGDYLAIYKRCRKKKEITLGLRQCLSILHLNRWQHISLIMFPVGLEVWDIVCVCESVCMYDVLIHISNIYQLYSSIFNIQMIGNSNSEFSGRSVQNRHLRLEDHWRNQRWSSPIRINTEQENPDTGNREWQGGKFISYQKERAGKNFKALSWVLLKLGAFERKK